MTAMDRFGRPAGFRLADLVPDLSRSRPAPSLESPKPQRSMNLQAAIAAFILAAVLVAAACQPAPEAPTGNAAGGAWRGDVPVYVTSNGWHTGIAFERARLPAGAVPEAGDFPAAAFLEFGWGDAEYYPAPRPTPGMALGAAFGANPAVVHLSGLPAHPRLVQPTAEIVEIRLSREGFLRLIRYLDSAFARGDGQRAHASARGLHGFSLFYPATGTFSLANTCNTWTARGLANAGVPVQPSGVVQAEDLMAQLRPLAAGNRLETSASFERQRRIASSVPHRRAHRVAAGLGRRECANDAGRGRPTLAGRQRRPRDLEETRS